MWSAEGSFARRQLEKHGWTDGAGLGLNEHGIKEAVKVKLKMDTAGVGHDPAKEFTHHWWDEAFNRAASSITVETENGQVMVKSKDKKKHRKEQLVSARKMLYSNFVKTSLLSNGAEKTVPREKDASGHSLDEESQPKTQTLLLPEEELFRKCGGRTAHKAARHGLKLNGKLARVEEQERLLLEQYQKTKHRSAYSSHMLNGHKDTATPAKGDVTFEDVSQNFGAETKTDKQKKRKREREERADSPFSEESGEDTRKQQQAEARSSEGESEGSAHIEHATLNVNSPMTAPVNHKERKIIQRKAREGLKTFQDSKLSDAANAVSKKVDQFHTKCPENGCDSVPIEGCHVAESESTTAGRKKKPKRKKNNTRRL